MASRKGRPCSYQVPRIRILQDSSSSRMPLFAAEHKTSYSSYMQKASVSHLKNNLSAYLRRVRAGHAIVIYDRDIPIARLERIESTGLGSDQLVSLQAKGVTRLPVRRESAAVILAKLQNALPPAARLLEAMQEDRSEDR